MSRDRSVRWWWGVSVVVLAGCGRLLPLYGDDPENPATVAPGPGQPNSYQCDCTCEDGAKTIEFGMVSALDDAEERESNRVVSINDSTLDLGTNANGAEQLVGLMFEGALPLGAEIESAYVQFTAQSATSGPASFTIRVQDAESPTAFQSTNGNISDRNLAPSAVTWTNVPSWDAAEDAGAAQRTPDLKDLLNDLTSSVSWNGSGIVLVLDGTGRRAAWSFDGNPASAPVLTVTFRANRSAVFPLAVCMPESLNPNRPGNEVPTGAALAADCANRVTDTVNGLADACGFPACTCAIAPHPTIPGDFAPRRFAIACDQTCDEEVVTDTCSNFAPESGAVTATNAAGDVPVCVTHSPLASALYGQRSQCELSGLADIRVEDETERRGTRGTMVLVGRPCPGGSCSVGVELGLDVDDVQFDTFFAEANFVQLSSVGKSVANRPLSLNGSGEGTISPGDVDASNHGTRLPEDDGEVAETLAYTQRNMGAFPVTVDWSANACSLDGSLAASEGFEVSFVEPVTGTIVNQPPTANAGSDRLDVECNVEGGARLLLDGGLSSDPDGSGDLASIRWFAGSRSGPEVGYALQAVVSQTGLGADGTWVLRVVDGGGQSDEDTVTTRVVDSEAPTILCNAPATIVPPDAQHPAVFTATASDVCAGALTPALSEPTCYFFNKAGKRVNRDQCLVSFSGATATISESGGVGDFISWTATVSDGNGNSDTETCTVEVVRKQ